MNMRRMTPEESLEAANLEIFHPYRDAGLTFLDPPAWFWRKMPRPTISADAISDYPAQQDVMGPKIDRINTIKAEHAVMYNQSVVRIASAHITDEVTIGDQLLAVFRRKMKARNVYRKGIPQYLDGVQDSYAKGANTLLPVSDGQSDLSKMGADDIFRLPIPGMRNYFHGVWEILPQLMPLYESGFAGQIRLCTTIPDLPQFAKDLIELVYPGLLDRVVIDRFRPIDPLTPERLYTDFLAGFDWSFYASLVPGDPVDVGLPSAAVADPKFDIYNRNDAFAFFFSFANGYTCHQKAFRDRAVARIADMDTAHLPKRFWISRKGSDRRPVMKDEDALLAELKQFGVQEVRLEELSGAEQVALFHNAELVLGQHGAGFTNIMFCSADTHVIEIGHGETIERWRAFHPLASVAGCDYACVFADFDTADPSVKPNLREDGFPVPALGPDAKSAFMSRVKAALGSKV